MKIWSNELKNYLAILERQDPDLYKYTRANHMAMEAVVGGKGPDGDPIAGARMVANISSAHVPAFCKPKPGSKAYKNGYDLKRYYRIGEAPDREPKNREVVDDALPLGGVTPDRVYFGAVELNGSGIRFYGDVCLVLSPESLHEDTVVLDRNSYDLIRSPLRDKINVQSGAARDALRQAEAENLAGIWKHDIAAMSAMKVLRVLGQRDRRYTIGQISETVCDDEDYMEVLKIDSFGAADLQEARFSAAEAAHDALAGDRLFTGSIPRAESLIWRSRRNRAEVELRDQGVRLHVVTTSGRTKD
jgi:hypothetical protein